MTPRTSSGSWSEARPAGADIIDLDRYMRGTRPARKRADPLHERLVVDAGVVGARKAPSAPSSLSAGSVASGASVASRSRSRSRGARSGRAGDGAAKRFSHDSGLSDTSYARRPHAHRPHRCTGGTVVAPAQGDALRARASSSSLRAFRAALERALRDQQAQIARVAQLCERQAERRSDRRAERRERTERRTPTSTELSSSSRSTDPRHRDKHRTSECKTYKIIMSKLDELNRLFAARRAAPAPPRPAATRPAVLQRDSSGSVTVSDKLCATDFPQQTTRRSSSKRLVERGAGGECRPAAGGAVAAGGAGAAGGAAAEGANTRVITCALSIDIPPGSNVTTESVVRGSTSEDDSGAGSARSGSGGSASEQSALRGRFDLEDPVHLYAQAKRLQALHATTRRARSVDPRAGSTLGSALGSPLGSVRGRDVSLCALCRAYWRLARRCFTAPLGAMRGQPLF